MIGAKGGVCDLRTRTDAGSPCRCVCKTLAGSQSGKVNRDLFGIITDPKDFVAPGPAG